MRVWAGWRVGQAKERREEARVAHGGSGSVDRRALRRESPWYACLARMWERRGRSPKPPVATDPVRRGLEMGAAGKRVRRSENVKGCMEGGRGRNSPRKRIGARQ